MVNKYCGHLHRRLNRREKRRQVACKVCACRTYDCEMSVLKTMKESWESTNGQASTTKSRWVARPYSLSGGTGTTIAVALGPPLATAYVNVQPCPAAPMRPYLSMHTSPRWKLVP